MYTELLPPFSLEGRYVYLQQLFLYNDFLVYPPGGYVPCCMSHLFSSSPWLATIVWLEFYRHTPDRTIYPEHLQEQLEVVQH